MSVRPSLPGALPEGQADERCVDAVETDGGVAVCGLTIKAEIVFRKTPFR
jgi:hypothetical protein